MGNRKKAAGKCDEKKERRGTEHVASVKPTRTERKFLPEDVRKTNQKNYK